MAAARGGDSYRRLGRRATPATGLGAHWAGIHNRGAPQHERLHIMFGMRPFLLCPPVVTS